jgi:hypothetical protein
LTLEDRTDNLSRNVCNKLPHYAAQNPKRAINLFYTPAEARNHASVALSCHPLRDSSIFTYGTLQIVVTTSYFDLFYVHYMGHCPLPGACNLGLIIWDSRSTEGIQWKWSDFLLGPIHLNGHWHKFTFFFPSVCPVSSYHMFKISIRRVQNRLCFTPLCFTPLCLNAPYQFTLLPNLRPLILGLTFFGWILLPRLFLFFLMEIQFFIYAFFI